MVAESDWKKFRQLYFVALERFSARILDECQTVCRDDARTAHERYGDLFGLIRDRNKLMAMIFDDPRRSEAHLSLMLMVRHGLVTENELSRFTLELQDSARDE
ncbi:MAG TPA: hypothetical protein VFL78_08005 [Rhodanobacteraceae bacterium]|nr:hypothetical protein [Rhodanobacteraceae bacterium]